MKDYAIAVVAALDDEVKPAIRRLQVDLSAHIRPALYRAGILANKSVVIVRSGVGKNAMERAARHLSERYSPKHVLHVGYCGALEPKLVAGDLVVASSVVDDDSGKEFNIAAANVEAARSICSEKGFRSSSGKMVTSGKYLNKPHDKAFVGTKYGACAVDMESSALCSVVGCENLTVVRAVVDPMDYELPKLGEAMDEEGEINCANLVGSAIVNPKRILEIPKMAYLASCARSSIASFIDAWLEAI